MKYVFGASSHLVFYLCVKYIKIHQLLHDDCVFLLTRNYHEPQEFTKRYSHIIHTNYNLTGSSQGRIFAGWKIWDTLRNKHKFDALVDSYIGDSDFIYYTQICNNDLCSLMVSKKNCKGYYITEDGSGSYRMVNPRTFVGWKSWLFSGFLKPVFPRFYAVKGHFIETDNPKFRGCIATTSYCFPLHQHVLEVVGVPFGKTELNFHPDAVISIDPLYLYVDNDVVRVGYEMMNTYMQHKGYTKVAYKFHPNFYTKAASQLRVEYEKMIFDCFHFSMIELSDTTCIENVLNTYHCDFYTSFSSICIYANEMGVKCYSNLPYLKKYVPSLKLPTFFDNICTFIN